MLTAEAQGRRHVPPDVRVRRGRTRAVATAAAGRRPAEPQGQQLALRARPLRAWVGPARAARAASSSPRAVRRHLLELAAGERAPRGGRACGHARRAVAGRLPRPVVDLRVPPYPTRAHTAAHARLEAWALRRAAAVTRRQPADRRRPRGAAPLARRAARTCCPTASTAPSGRRTSLGDGFWFVHTGPAVRPRAAGRGVPRPRSRRCRPTSRRCSSASTRAACGPTPTGSVSATACASSRSCRCRSRSATSAPPTRCCWSTGAGRSPCRARCSSTCRPAGRSSPSRRPAPPPAACSPRSVAARACCPTTRWRSRWRRSSRPCATAARPVADPAALAPLRARPPHGRARRPSSTASSRTLGRRPGRPERRPRDRSAPER